MINTRFCSLACQIDSKSLAGCPAGSSVIWAPVCSTLTLYLLALAESCVAPLLLVLGTTITYQYLFSYCYVSVIISDLCTWCKVTCHWHDHKYWNSEHTLVLPDWASFGSANSRVDEYIIMIINDYYSITISDSQFTLYSVGTDTHTHTHTHIHAYTIFWSQEMLFVNLFVAHTVILIGRMWILRNI